MKRILSLFVLNLFFISGLWAQQTSVTVPFTDESGLPLPGATIIVENSKPARYSFLAMSGTKTTLSPSVTKLPISSAYKPMPIQISSKIKAIKQFFHYKIRLVKTPLFKGFFLVYRP